MLKLNLMLAAVALATLFVAAPGASPAIAQSGTQSQQQACSRDVSRHCRRVMNDGDMAVFQCLKTNRPRLSAACGQVIDSH